MQIKKAQLMKQLSIYTIDSQMLINNMKDNNYLSNASDIEKELYNALHNQGKNNIDLDFADLVSIADESKIIHLLQTDIEEKNLHLIKKILKDSSGVLIQFKSHSDYPKNIFSNFISKYLDSYNENTNIIFGFYNDNTMAKTEAKILMVIA